MLIELLAGANHGLTLFGILIYTALFLRKITRSHKLLNFLLCFHIVRLLVSALYYAAEPSIWQLVAGCLEIILIVLNRMMARFF